MKRKIIKARNGIRLPIPYSEYYTDEYYSKEDAPYTGDYYYWPEGFYTFNSANLRPLGHPNYANVPTNDGQMFIDIDKPFPKGVVPVPILVRSNLIVNPAKLFAREILDKAVLKNTSKSDREGETLIYETRLTPEEEAAFQKWYALYAGYSNIDANPDNPEHEYDYRGYWYTTLDRGNRPTWLNTPLSDKWKRPGHPTFSSESVYNGPLTPGGTWVVDQNGEKQFIPSWFNNMVNNGHKRTTAIVDENGNVILFVLPEVVISRKTGGKLIKRNK